MSILDPKADAAAIEPLVDKETDKIVVLIQSAVRQVLAELPTILDGYVITISVNKKAK